MWIARVSRAAVGQVFTCDADAAAVRRSGDSRPHGDVTGDVAVWTLLKAFSRRWHGVGRRGRSRMGKRASPVAVSCRLTKNRKRRSSGADVVQRLVELNGTRARSLKAG